VDCFAQYEERTDTWTDNDGTEHTDTYTVAVPVSLEMAYANIHSSMSVEITDTVRKNADKAYSRTHSGGATFSGGYLRGDGSLIYLINLDGVYDVVSQKPSGNQRDRQFKSFVYRYRRKYLSIQDSSFNSIASFAAFGNPPESGWHIL